MLCNKISENPQFFFHNFQRHSLLTALHAKKLLVLVFEQRSLEQLTKSKIVKVKSFYNNLTHHMSRLTESVCFLGHPNVQCTYRVRQTEKNNKKINKLTLSKIIIIIPATTIILPKKCLNVRELYLLKRTNCPQEAV